MHAIQRKLFWALPDNAKWVASTLLVVGGILISASARISSKPDVFWLFLVGHLIWIAAAAKKSDRSLLVLNAAMAAMDAYAIWVRM